jgi:dihydrodipicolinate synthase/N-acetylneuraminate lyase
VTPDEARARWWGVVVPLVTIFAEDGSLDLNATANHVRWIIDRGARPGNTIFLAAGSGGDFPMLNLAERKQVIRAITDVAVGRVPVIVGVQSTDIRDTIALCELAEDTGADAVQIASPYYYDGRPGDAVAWFEEVARNTRVGFALYNNWYTGYDMPLELIDRLLDLPNSIGIKWSSPDVNVYYAGIRRFLPRAAVVDNSLLPIMPHLLGCRAFISHVPNFYPEHCWSVWALMEQGQYREAQEADDRLMVPYRQLVGQIQRETAGEGVFVKAAMAAAGLRTGGSRLPSRDAVASPEIRDQFKRLLVGLKDQEAGLASAMTSFR